MVAATLALSACNTPVTVTPDAPTFDSPMAATFDPAVCSAVVVQPDFTSQEAMGETLPGTVWNGPAVNTETGQPVIPAGSIVATTYLQLRPDPTSQRTFGEVGGRVFDALFTSRGLLAVATVTSNQCAVARTITVWESEEAMIGFVTSEAHSEAMLRVGEMSRGGSITTSFIANASVDVAWPEIARQFVGHSGPVY